jgi:hypothetical protein
VKWANSATEPAPGAERRVEGHTAVADRAAHGPAHVDAATPMPPPALADPAGQLPGQRAHRGAQGAQLRRGGAQHVQVLEPARGDEPDTGPAAVGDQPAVHLVGDHPPQALDARRQLVA